MKKIISLMLVAVMLITSLVMFASGASVAPSGAVLPPQAAKQNTIESARRSAKNFFIINTTFHFFSVLAF